MADEIKSICCGKPTILLNGGLIRDMKCSLCGHTFSVEEYHEYKKRNKNRKSKIRFGTSPSKAANEFNA